MPETSARITRPPRRIAARELSIDVVTSESRGIIEYPSHFDHDLVSPVGLVFEAVEYTGTPGPSAQACEGGWFSQLPDSMHADQDAFLLDHGFVM